MIAAVIAAVLAVIAAWELYFRKNWLKGVSVDVRFQESAVYRGDELHLTEIIENRKRMPLFIFEAAFRTQKGLKFIDAEEENVTESDYIYKRDVFSLLGRERITRKYRLLGVKRGLYTISQADCHAVSLPLGRRLACDLDLRDSVYVYAGKTDIRGILSEITSIMGETESARRVFEDPFAFAQIREYMPSDPLKNVNWKATAKAGGLMVNTFASVRSERIRIYLDVEDRNIRRQQALIEEAVSCAACLCRSLLGKGHAVSLCVNAETEDGRPFVLEEARGKTRLKTIEQFLTTDFSKCAVTDFPALLSGSVSREEIPVILSKNDSAAVYEAACELTKNGLPGIWIVLKERGEPAGFAPTETLRIVRREA